MMKKHSLTRRYALKSALALLSVVLVATFVYHRQREAGDAHGRIESPGLLPWEGVGGCGEGGSGGMSGDGIKWIGKGVSGGLIDVEMLPRYSFGRTFSRLSIAPRISFKPTWTTTMGVTVPFASKRGMVQHQTILPPEEHTTGGLGDIAVDVSRTFGMSGQFSAAFSLTVPTGQYDIKRGADHDQKFLPVDLQMGQGVFNAGLSLEYTRDVEDGMWIGRASFQHPFNMRPFSEENEFLDDYFQDYKGRRNNDRFYYRFKPYGESDLGAYVPPSLATAVYYAYTGKRDYTHSWGVSFSVPLAVAWIPSYETGHYDPRPDPDHQAWSAALTYGLEFSRQKYPLFFAVSLPIHDKAGGEGKDIYDEDPMKQWNGPDWEDFLQQWTIALGFKSTMF